MGMLDTYGLRAAVGGMRHGNQREEHGRTASGAPAADLPVKRGVHGNAQEYE